MKRRFVLVAFLLLSSFAVAQTGAPPAQLLRQLEPLNPTEQGYRAGIAEPPAEFLGSRTAQLAGRGEIPLAVEEFVLALEVMGDAAPHHARFGLALLEVAEESFPPSRHTLGPQDAEIVIREFSDLQCPYCARYATGVHADAQLAAEAAECVTAANTPAALRTYHDALFARQEAGAGLGDAPPYFVRLAREVGLSPGGVAACLEAGRYTGVGQEAFRVARQELGLNSTPLVFVGGYRVPTAAGTLAGYERATARLAAFTE